MTPPSAVLMIAGFLALAPCRAVAQDFNGDRFGDVAIGVASEELGGMDAAGAVHVMYGSTGGVPTAGAQFFNQDTPGIPDTSEFADFWGAALAWGDFDNDGFDDLAIGAPGDNLDNQGQEATGTVTVLFGSSSGLTVARAQWWHQDSPNVPGTSRLGDNFGTALTTGDFDADGFDDLAIGVPSDCVTSVDGPVCGEGSVVVLQGSATGLTTMRSRHWSQNSAGILDISEAGDHFGLSLTTGDFDGDGFHDLAIGAPDEDRLFNGENVPNAGAVHVLYGSASGLTAAGDQQFTEAGALPSDPLPDPRCDACGEKFGAHLISGDFDGDGFDDLAAGAPTEYLTATNTPRAGAVIAIYGSFDGLAVSGSQYWTQDAGLEDVAEAGDLFGSALAAGDFDKDGFTDLAVGVPQEDVAGGFGVKRDAGAVNVIYGSGAGLAAGGNQFLNQNSTGVADAAEPGDQFGSALAAANLDGRFSARDLVVGIPPEDVGTVGDAGAIQVFYGVAGSRVFADRAPFIHQDTAGVEDAAEIGDSFGGWLVQP